MAGSCWPRDAATAAARPCGIVRRHEAAEVSIGELFVSVFGSAVPIGGALMLYVRLDCKRKGWGRNDGDGRLPIGRATWRAGWAPAMPVIVLGSIYGGVFTPTGAGAVAVFYAFVVGTLIHCGIGCSGLYRILGNSVIGSAVILFIIAKVGLFACLIRRAGLPDAIGQWVEELLQSHFLFLLGVDAALFVIGMFIETSASIILLAPILAPVPAHFGVDLFGA